MTAPSRSLRWSSEPAQRIGFTQGKGSPRGLPPPTTTLPENSDPNAARVATRRLWRSRAPAPSGKKVGDQSFPAFSRASGTHAQNGGKHQQPRLTAPGEAWPAQAPPTRAWGPSATGTTQQNGLRAAGRLTGKTRASPPRLIPRGCSVRFLDGECLAWVLLSSGVSPSGGGRRRRREGLGRRAVGRLLMDWGGGVCLGIGIGREGWAGAERAWAGGGRGWVQESAGGTARTRLWGRLGVGPRRQVGLGSGRREEVPGVCAVSAMRGAAGVLPGGIRRMQYVQKDEGRCWEDWVG